MPSILEGIEKSKKIEWDDVLNLVITGMPSILLQDMSEILASLVLNLVITGMPSILERATDTKNIRLSFKPCYKWNAFNT